MATRSASWRGTPHFAAVAYTHNVYSPIEALQPPSVTFTAPIQSDARMTCVATGSCCGMTCSGSSAAATGVKQLRTLITSQRTATREEGKSVMPVQSSNESVLCTTSMTVPVSHRLAWGEITPMAREGTRIASITHRWPSTSTARPWFSKLLGVCFQPAPWSISVTNANDVEPTCRALSSRNTVQRRCAARRHHSARDVAGLALGI